jgi:hypothetical protein
MADGGASQRRGLTSAITPIGQSSTLSPVETSGISYYSSASGPGFPVDFSSSVSRAKQSLLSSLNVASPETPNQGTTYINTNLGARGAHDLSVTPYRAKSVGFTLGASTPETPNHGTTYINSTLGSITPYGGGGTVIVTTYKLRARDSGPGPLAYVEWTTTSTPLSVGSFGGIMPNGGPLVELTLLSFISR